MRNFCHGIKCCIDIGYSYSGGYFGPKENAVVQTAATSAGSLTGLFVAAVPGKLSRLELRLTLANNDP